MDQELEKLHLEIERLRLENENLKMKQENQRSSKAWVWALIPITAILVGSFSELWTTIIQTFFK